MLTILFVHAGTDDREMYADYLRAHGYAVIEASDTDSALLDLPSAEVLLTGLMVPGTLTGVELIATARRKRQQLPVIVITASIVAEHHAAAAKAGAEVLLLKPCYPADLLAAIRSLVGHHHAIHARRSGG